MKRTSALIEKFHQTGAHNYHPLPIVLVRGKGSKVWDVEGKVYLDFLSAYSALNFGHAYPKFVATLTKQAKKLALCSRAFHAEELSLFCEELARFCELDSVLLMNSGAEAVETALKVARKWGYEKKRVAPERAKIVVMENNFHGRTVSLISFSSEALYRKNFGPFTPGFVTAKFGDPKSAQAAIDDNTVAVLTEPVQAEAGILVPPAGYLTSLRNLCDQRNVLLMLDEIQTGLGRTGKNFSFQHEGVRPDVLILGKSLGGGLLPVSAVVSRREVMEVIQPGTHGSTFGGNPLACAIGREVLKELKAKKLSNQAEKIGKTIRAELGKHKFSMVKAIRGQGALIGIELKPEAGGARKYCERLAEAGVLCKETHEHVIRIAPPLNISTADLKKGLAVICKVLW